MGRLLIAFTRLPSLALLTLDPTSNLYPASLLTCSDFKTPPTLSAIGNPALLQQPLIALFCSVQCPGDLILKTYDLAQALRDANLPTISGFHSPIEKDCLDILLRGTQPVIHCLARGLENIRLSPIQKQAVENDRLLILSPFSNQYRRTSTDLAQKRNLFVGTIASIIFIPFAASDSKTQAFAEKMTIAGKTIATFHSSHQSVLPQLGAEEFDIPTIISLLRKAQVDADSENCSS